MAPLSISGGLGPTARPVPLTSARGDMFGRSGGALTLDFTHQQGGEGTKGLMPEMRFHWKPLIRHQIGRTRGGGFLMA